MLLALRSLYEVIASTTPGTTGVWTTGGLSNNYVDLGSQVTLNLFAYSTANVALTSTSNLTAPAAGLADLSTTPTLVISDPTGNNAVFASPTHTANTGIYTQVYVPILSGRFSYAWYVSRAQETPLLVGEFNVVRGPQT